MPSSNHSTDDDTRIPLLHDLDQNQPDGYAETSVINHSEATTSISKHYAQKILFLSLGLAAYIYSLDASTTYTYLNYAASEFGNQSAVGSIQVVQSVTVAVGKPVVAKFADLGSRAFALTFVLSFYVCGYTLITASGSIATIAIGIALYAIGNTGLQILIQVLIADVTTLKWRGLINGLAALPFILNAFIGSNLSAAIVSGPGWRWGYGMFAIIMPISLAPLILMLFLTERRKPVASLTSEGRKTRKEWLQDSFERLNVPGLTLMGASLAFILLPLTLLGRTEGKSNNLILLVLGVSLMFVFGIWDFKFAKFPVVPARFFKNRTVIITSLIGGIDFASYFLTNTYLYAFVTVVKPWSLVNVTYFTQIQNIALAISGLGAGLLMKYLQRCKRLLIIGLLIRLLGTAMMVRSRGPNGSALEIVLSQILQGVGGGFAAVASQVASQASVRHIDLPMTTAVVLLVTEIGGACGGAMAGAMWGKMLPELLLKYLPLLSQEERDKLYGSISYATQFPRGSSTRDGVISGYDEVMKIMTVVAAVISVFPPLLAFFMPDWHLGDIHSAVEEEPENQENN